MTDGNETCIIGKCRTIWRLLIINIIWSLVPKSRNFKTNPTTKRTIINVYAFKDKFTRFYKLLLSSYCLTIGYLRAQYLWSIDDLPLSEIIRYCNPFNLISSWSRTIRGDTNEGYVKFSFIYI